MTFENISKHQHMQHTRVRFDFRRNKCLQCTSTVDNLCMGVSIADTLPRLLLSLCLLFSFGLSER